MIPHRLPAFFVICCAAILLLAIPANGAEELRYAVIAGGEKQAEMRYSFVQENGTLVMRSTAHSLEEEFWEDGEVIMDPLDFAPIESHKTVPLPAALMEVTTRYGEGEATITLNAPPGTKESRVPVPEPVYDLEQVPFLPVFLSLPEKDEWEIPVLVPVSGMHWRGRFQKIDEDSETVLFRFILAAEVLYFRYTRDEPHLMLTMDAPHRGYTLELIE